MNYTCVLSAIICTTITLATSTSMAEKIKVKKVKGSSAVIESTLPLEEGQTYEITPTNVSQDVDYKGSTIKSRQNSLSFGGSLEYLKSDLLQSNTMTVQGRYGWNFSNLEAGLVIELSSVDLGNGATTSFIGGGYFDYNLVTNRDPRDLIYGPFVLLATGSTQYPSSATGGSSTKLASNVGGFATYFLGGSSTAVRGEAFYNYQQINTTAVQNSVAGFGMRFLLEYYY